MGRLSTRKFKCLWLLIIVSIAATVCFPLMALPENREDCKLCGMWIDLYMKTRHVVQLKDGGSQSFCSITCAAKFIKQEGEGVASVMVADYETTGLLDVEKAFYLSGSDVPGVMSYTSRIAFGTRERAVSFMKAHGGEIVDFKSAMEDALR